MSILEKAFLKAMSLEGEDANPEQITNNKRTDSSQKDAALDRLDVKLDKPRAVEAHDIVNSRQGISQMSEVKRFTTEQLNEKRLIHTSMKDKQLLDRYRNIRTKLLAGSNKQNFVTLVTSVKSSKSQGLIAGNLAATFSLDEAKTSMLIEADISNPSLNSLFEMNDNKGLIDYLESDNWESNEVLQKTGIPRLRFVPSGLHRENSAEYFTSSKMSEFVNELLNRYPDRYPIINSPCVINSADTRILIELCEKIILVVPYGKCSDEEIMQAALAIGEKKLAGVILDGF